MPTASGTWIARSIGRAEAQPIVSVRNVWLLDLSSPRIGSRRAESSAPDDSESGRRRRWPFALCVAIYTVAAVAEFGGHGLGSGTMAGPGSADQISQIWWIAWADFALAHGHNPFFTSWQNTPVGVNVVANTSMLALGALVSPITSAFGPIVSWNVLERAALILSASSMCLVLRRWTNWWPAAFVGGALYGFSAYETTSIPHLFVVFAPLPPIFFLLLHELLARQRWPALRVGALLGLVCAVQYLISSEILASMVLLGAIATTLFLVANRRTLTSRWTYTIRAGVTAVCVGGVLLAGPVLYTLFGPGHLNGVPNSPTALSELHGDLLAPFVPGYFQRFSVHSLLAGYQLNSGGMYLGVPFALAVGTITVLLRRRGVVVMAGVLAAVSFVLSMGSTLNVDGRTTHIPLPFTVLAHTPLAQGLLSTRFALYTALFGAAIVSFGIDALYFRLLRSSGSAAAPPSGKSVLAVVSTLAIAVVVAVPMLPAGSQAVTPVVVPALFGSSAGGGIPTGSTVLAYPYPDNPVFPGSVFGFSFTKRYQGVNDALLDQAAGGLRFRIIGGYGWRRQGSRNTISPSALMPPIVKALFDFAFYGVTTSPGQASLLSSNHVTVDIASFLRRYGVSSVVALPVGSDPKLVTRALTATIGAPRHSDGVHLWLDVQNRLKVVRPTQFRVTGLPPTTDVVQPKDGGRVTGSQFLVARGSAAFGIRSVVFESVDRSSGQRTEICRGVQTRFGWICAWNSTSVPDGTYTLYSVATDELGQVTRSTGVVVHVANQPHP